ncbi:hypothetical protein [Caulobacter sp. CCH9-E1]|uniref:hypothetical protein n=1 Tax=Caulobacter sp. CCH9-E1 TaxID=1768768 RepID=UPI00082F7B18|nr:hypothetical protein [Caulobacter sp. CCH9-E1]
MNKPSIPGTFDAPYKVELVFNFDDMADDYRRMVAEWWCCYQTERRWFRRVHQSMGLATFYFEDLVEATMFRLSN